MIQIPDNSTILAPATLHLALYKEILKQKKDCLGIQVLTLSSWLSSFYHGQNKSDIEILYLYKDALKNISLSNAFYSSKEDYDFLNACLDFIKMAKTLFNPKRKRFTRNLKSSVSNSTQRRPNARCPFKFTRFRKHLYPKKRILSIRQLLDSSVD